MNSPDNHGIFKKQKQKKNIIILGLSVRKWGLGILAVLLLDSKQFAFTVTVTNTYINKVPFIRNLIDFSLYDLTVRPCKYFAQFPVPFLLALWKNCTGRQICDPSLSLHFLRHPSLDRAGGGNIEMKRIYLET